MTTALRVVMLLHPSSSQILTHMDKLPATAGLSCTESWAAVPTWPHGPSSPGPGREVPMTGPVCACVGCVRVRSRGPCPLFRLSADTVSSYSQSLSNFTYVRSA